MSIFQILCGGFLALVMWLVLTQYQSPIAIFVVVAFGALLFLRVAEGLEGLLSSLMELSGQAGVNVLYLTTIFKMIGVAWLAEFFCQLCRDAGSGALAVKLEFAAKVAILLLAYPVLAAVLRSVLELI